QRCVRQHRTVSDASRHAYSAQRADTIGGAHPVSRSPFDRNPRLLGLPGGAVQPREGTRTGPATFRKRRARLLRRHCGRSAEHDFARPVPRSGQCRQAPRRSGQARVRAGSRCAHRGTAGVLDRLRRGARPSAGLARAHGCAAGIASANRALLLTEPLRIAMSNRIRAYATTAPKAPLTAIDYDPGELGDEQVEIAVSHCGICHSDLSMIDNEWGSTRYPLVAGHEVIGTITALGPHAKGLRVGERVGLGWYAGSCMHCAHCMSGHHNLCREGEQTIVGRHGGFAERVRCHWSWAIALPDALDAKSAGPLFCGGLTVFSPLVDFDIRPTDRVGVVGIGGLGHMALKFLRAWGCEVTAFTSSESKHAEARELGAHNVVATRDAAALKRIARSLDFILVTVNVS